MWTHIPVPAFIFVWQAAKPRTAKFNLYFPVVAIWYSLQLDVPIHFWSLVGATFVFFGKPSSFSQSTNTEATLGLIV